MIVKVDYQDFLSRLNLVQFVLDREIGTGLRISRMRPIIVNILPAHITCCETGFLEIYISRQLNLRLRFLAYQSLISLNMLMRGT